MDAMPIPFGYLAAEKSGEFLGIIEIQLEVAEDQWRMPVTRGNFTSSCGVAGVVAGSLASETESEAAFAEFAGPVDVLRRNLLEDGDDARLALAQTLGDELRAEHRFTRSGRPGQEETVAFGNAAAQQHVERADAGRQTPPALDVR